MRLTIAYSKIKKRNLVLINNDTHQRETVSERPVRPPLSSKYQSGEFRCSWEVNLCNSIILVVHVCKAVAEFRSFVMNNKAFGNLFCNLQKSFHTSTGSSDSNNRGYRSFFKLNNSICIYKKS